MKIQLTKTATIVLSSLMLTTGCSKAQETAASPQITMGNGAVNSIQIDGLMRQSGEKVFSDTRTDGDEVSTFRTNSTAITFPTVTIENPGWIVLHPVIDGKPNGDIVSGFSYLDAGENIDVTIDMVHPADVGSKYLVMLHNDVDADRVFDFVFVEDGINVEDRAVFEGTNMIAHFISLP
ncbi:MAG: hypothetical protein ABJN22_05070 [Litorimonas sp.]